MVGLDNLVAYNANVTSTARFYGFTADVEPQDTGVYTNFTNGLSDSQLTSAQATARQSVMSDWLTLHSEAQALLTKAGLEFSSAMPWWLTNYNGESVNVSWPSTSSPYQCVMNYMMPLMNEYIVLSYNTYTSNTISRVQPPAAYASKYYPATKVRAGMDVVIGNGAYVSYGDTPPLNNKAQVLSDASTIESGLASYSSFSGIMIEDWADWNIMFAY